MFNLLFIGLNEDQLPYLYELKKTNKFFIIGVDQNPNPLGKPYVNFFINKNYDLCDAIFYEIKKNNILNPIHYIFTASSQFSHRLASFIASKFGIPYTPIESIEIILNKYKFYKFLLNNSFPLPDSNFIENENHLNNFLKKINKNKFYYLKSDQSKNPNYVYKIEPLNFDFSIINWKRDRYLNYGYVLQEEVHGTHLRFNLYGNRFNVFDFFNDNKILLSPKNRNIFIKIHNCLNNIVKKLDIINLLVKFDVIQYSDSFVILDIGIDPPFRMLRYFQEQSLDFNKFYISHLLNGVISYPDIADS